MFADGRYYVGTGALRMCQLKTWGPGGGGSDSGPHCGRSGYHDEGCSGGRPLLSAPPAHARGHSECHMLRGGGRVGRAWGGDGLFVVACWLVGGCGLAMVPGRAFPIVRRLEDKHVVTVSR
jgi:hypothetical protein